MNRGLLFLLCVGCTPSQILVRKAPRDAIAAAEARLADREVVIDASGARPDRIRTGTFCYPAPTATSQSWDASFGRTRPGPVPFTVEGPMHEQDEAVAECPYLFQIEVIAIPKGQETELIVNDAWWQAVPGKCVPVGDPLTGVMSCDYTYSGAKAKGDAAKFFYGLLTGL